MAKLAKWHNGQLSICTRVHAPGYSIHASNHIVGDSVPDGWAVVPDDITEADFVLPWVQPSGAHDAYKLGAVVAHNNERWWSLIDANVWQPGVSGWAQLGNTTLSWVRPTGAHDAYSAGAVVFHAGKVWRSLVGANVWEPGVANWRETFLTPPGIESPLPQWVQPSGAGDAYSIGAKVVHNGKRWRSTVDNNVWAPGVYGWIEF